jgi:hypothetical protein
MYNMKSFLISSIAASLVIAATHAHAELGWTLGECEQQYGKQVSVSDQWPGRTEYTFYINGYTIQAFMLDGKVSRIIYIMYPAQSWNDNKEDIPKLLSANAPSALWAGPAKGDAVDGSSWQGTEGGKVLYYALLPQGNWFYIFTKEDAYAVAEAKAYCLAELTHPAHAAAIQEVQDCTHALANARKISGDIDLIHRDEKALTAALEAQKAAAEEVRKDAEAEVQQDFNMVIIRP